MSDDSVKKEFGVEDLFDMADREGVAIATVKDGYFLVFTRGHMERMMAMMNEKKQDRCAVFVKHRQFKN